MLYITHSTRWFWGSPHNKTDTSAVAHMDIYPKQDYWGWQISPCLFRLGFATLWVTMDTFYMQNILDFWVAGCPPQENISLKICRPQFHWNIQLALHTPAASGAAECAGPPATRSRPPPHKPAPPCEQLGEWRLGRTPLKSVQLLHQLISSPSEAPTVVSHPASS